MYFTEVHIAVLIGNRITTSKSVYAAITHTCRVALLEGREYTSTVESDSIKQSVWVELYLRYIATCDCIYNNACQLNTLNMYSRSLAGQETYGPSSLPKQRTQIEIGFSIAWAASNRVPAIIFTRCHN